MLSCRGMFLPYGAQPATQMDDSQGWPQLCRAIFILVLLGKEKESEAWSPDGHASLHALLQPRCDCTNPVTWTKPSGELQGKSCRLTAGGPAIFRSSQPQASLWISQSVPFITQNFLWWDINQISTCKGKMEGLASGRSLLLPLFYQVWVQCINHSRCFETLGEHITDGQINCFPTLLFQASFLCCFTFSLIPPPGANHQ